MFDWIIEIKEPQFSLNDEDGQLKIERIESATALNKMSVVCQFFASIDAITGNDGLTSFPTPTEDSLTTIMNEIAPHYEDVKKIFINGELKEINVRCL
ncbi:hypothetical protein [Solibacillus sp. FSL H8-0538]|uniref:hypothetical protein n=1 Tax=Solibacillus sp. FSL H8-0538 TaxID=2921400 RepID=UPI0030F705B1